MTVVVVVTMFEINYYRTGRHFLNECEMYLREKKAFNNLTLGIVNRFAEEKPNEVLLLSIKDENRSIVLTGFMTPPQRLVLYSHEVNEKCLNFLIKSLTEKELELPGVLGPNDLAEQFAKQWCSLKKLKLDEYIKERVYKLEKLKKIVTSKGSFRIAEEKDIPHMIPYHQEFMLEAMGENVNEADSRNLLQTKIVNQQFYVWEDLVHGETDDSDDHNEIVSMASWSRPIGDSISIGFVYTPKKHRKKGYASSCVSEFSRQLLKKYKYTTLFTDLSNPISNSIYKKMGYEEVGDIYAIDFKTS